MESQKKTMIWVAIVVVVLIVAGFLYFSGKDGVTPDDQGTTEDQAGGTLPEGSGNAGADDSMVSVLSVYDHPTLGKILADSRGMTLYLFTKDTDGTSVCYDQCAVAWPPLITPGAPTGAAGVPAGKLGTTTRTDGKTQVTYDGQPLYYYFTDEKPGDATGEGVGDVWFVIKVE